jgi:hypothetical protein
MKKITLVALVAALGCAGASQSTRRGTESISGHWSGAIDRDGWQRPLAVDIEESGATYAGSWMSLETQPGIMLDRVEVQGDSVRFALKTLAFEGHLSGRSLSGTVTDTAANKPSGQFTLTRVDPRETVVP